MKRKIALISDEAFMIADHERGGVDGQRAYTAEVARNLSQIGYQVDVFASKAEESRTELEEWLENVRVVHVPPGTSVSTQVCQEDLPDAMHEFAGYVLSFCREQEKPYDLIHAISWESGWAAVEIKAALGIPFVITYPGRDEEGRPLQQGENVFPGKRVEAEVRILRDADGIVADSPHDREELISLYAADPSYIAQIPSAVNSEGDEAENSSAAWQRFTSLLVQFYEDVLAVRRVAILQTDPAALATGQPADRDGLQTVDRAFETAIQTLRESRAALGEQILEAASLMIECLQRGGKIMVCGAGAADTDARQFGTELMGRLLLSGLTDLPVLQMSAEGRSSAYLANERDHTTIFSRQVEALGRPGDILLAIAREEDLACLAEAFRSARLHNLTCVSLTGRAAEDVASQADVALVVPSSSVRWTREVQVLLLDLLCDLVEEGLTGAHCIPAENLHDASSALRLSKRLVD